jgi:peptidoglycan/LPS O-acetylase OafA/YrhL
VEGNYLKELSSKQIWLWTYMHNFLQAYGPRQLPGLGHFWSLAIEEQFYLFWPFVVYALGTRSLSRTCLAICLIVGILRPLLLSWGYTPWAVRELTFTRVDTLVYGALFALSIRNETITQLLLKYRWILIGLTAIVIVVLGVVSRDFKGEGYWMQVVGYPAVAFASGLFIFYSSVSDIQNQSNRLLARGLLPNLGLYSYGLYVFHYPIVQAVRNLVETMHLERYFESVAFIRLVEFLIIMPASYAIALASFWLYERHWLKLKNYFDYYSRKEVANS